MEIPSWSTSFGVAGMYDQRMLWRPLTACVLIALLGGRAHAQRAEADVEFQRGRALLAKGDIAEACAAFEASMKLDPERGTLYNLGLCHEKLGKLASAWSELEELSRTDTNEARARDAKAHAAALLPRLPRMHLVVESAADGLVVMRDNVDVTPLVNKQAPVDPGKYTFEARAPGRQTFTLEVDLTTEGKTVEVEIPALHEHHDGGGDGSGSGSGTAPVDESAFPVELSRRPILIPKGMGEVSAGLSASTADRYDRTGFDAGASARVRLGPFEASAVAGFHLRWHNTMYKPNPWDTIGIGVRYPIEPALVVGLTYVEVQPLRADNRGSDVGANVERKLFMYPKVAVDGRAGFLFSQRQNDGNAFTIVGEGRVQFSIAGGLSAEGFAGLRLNLGGMLHDYTVGFDGAVLALYAIKPQFDAFAQIGTGLVPDSSLHTYLVGASWRTR